MRLFIILTFLTGTWGNAAESEHPYDGLKGSVYLLDSKREKKIFSYTLHISDQRTMEIHRSDFYDMDNQPAATEMLVLNEKDELIRYSVTHHQMKHQGEIEKKDDKIVFKYTEKDGKTKTSEEAWEENFVVGPTLVPYLQKHWDKLLKGEEIKVRFGVPQRRESVGFKLFKVGEEKIGEHEVVVIKMQATSFFINLVVRALIFKLAWDGSRVFEMQGRTTPFLKVGKDDFKEVDAETLFHQEEQLKRKGSTWKSERPANLSPAS